MGLYRSVRHDEQSGGRKCRGTKRGETTTITHQLLVVKIFPLIKQRENKITTFIKYVFYRVFFYRAIPKYIFAGWL